MWKPRPLRHDASTAISNDVAQQPPPPQDETATRGWSSDEHLRFLDGLELFGTSSADGSTPWMAIASHVRTRNESDTREHGERYLHALLTQTLLVSKGQGSSSTSWTPDEDVVFEAALAKWIHTPHAWTKIATHLPGKTVYDVMDRYDALLRDLSAIETGVTPPPIADMHEANMALICSIAKAQDNHVLFEVFKDAFDSPCSVEIATYVASAVVGMVASSSGGKSTHATVVKRGRPKGKVPKAPPAATQSGGKKPPRAKKSPKMSKTTKGVHPGLGVLSTTSQPQLDMASHPKLSRIPHMTPHANAGGPFTLPPLLDGKLLAIPGGMVQLPGGRAGGMLLHRPEHRSA
ncbi:hypothetical protein H310_13125 [Aphanomyces invadans]|uniref:Uncharacterized protein n=1 Tax=Aphanomyces invadans TaxID=157072 RepID=A0A024TH48_9STRA|nr:hypothetical protein H310_13125 [Aphanomyces invadans]ETV92687.1 hypothetical protein H310_13125 [Aphanomyces invadans]|eukprot:XP_008878723.1 hypothetical protein H310_13125 [Aphanomyces invadans]